MTRAPRKGGRPVITPQRILAGKLPPRERTDLPRMRKFIPENPPDRALRAVRARSGGPQNQVPLPAGRGSLSFRKGTGQICPPQIPFGKVLAPPGIRS